MMGKTLVEEPRLDKSRTEAGLFDVNALRNEFPILKQKVHGHPLVYLDNAATSQKPQCVIDALVRFYTEDCSNIHRGVHSLSERATQMYEDVRVKVQQFIGAGSPEEIVFVRGTTEAVNLVASSFGGQFIREGDEIVISAMEHHSNIVPWQMIAEKQGACVKVLPITKKGELCLDRFQEMLTPKTKIVAITHVSNVIGTVNPVKKLVEIAHRRSVPVLIDGAQSAPHLSVNVREIDCDFYTISGHKMYGPTGVGVLYGKKQWLDAIPPYQGGGHMIQSVSFEETTYSTAPHKFEAGTAAISAGIGLGAAVDFLNRYGLNRLAQYEDSLLKYAKAALSRIDGLKWIGEPADRVSVLSFMLGDIHPHDVGTILDQKGIAIRVGHHCAQPLMDFYGVPATCRVSLACYNTAKEIDYLCEALEEVKGVFS